MEIQNEILKDYTNYCNKTLLQAFGNYDAGQYDPIYLYQRYKCRIIEPKKRLVEEASGLCIPEKYKQFYRSIRSAIIKGEDLKKYQSRKLKNLDYDDDMLSHWGIQHIHLGNAVEHDGFVKRTDDLLFIYFSTETAYVIGVFDHDSWNNPEIIELMHRNWPHLLAELEIKTGSIKLSPKDYKAFRTKNANVPITLQDGTVYLFPGLGVTLNGSPILAVINSQKVIYMFNRYFEIVKENIDYILACDPENRKKEALITIGLDSISDEIVFKIKETDFKFTF